MCTSLIWCWKELGEIVPGKLCICAGYFGSLQFLFSRSLVAFTVSKVSFIEEQKARLTRIDAQAVVGLSCSHRHTAPFFIMGHK